MAEPLSAARAELWNDGRFGAILDGLPEAILVLDRELRLVHANAFAVDILGRSLDDAAGESLWDLLPHLSSTEAWSVVPAAAKTGSEGQFSYRSTRTGRWLSARVFSVGDLLVFHTNDLSEAKAADARLAATTDALPAFVAYVDAELVYRFCNRRYEDWFGRPRSTIVGRPMREILGDATFERLLPYLQQALGGEKSEHAQWLDFAQGQRFMRAVYVPSLDEEGRVEGLSIMVADETEAKGFEERLRESEQRLSLAIEAADLGTWDVDLVTGVARCSAAAARILGRPDSEFSVRLEELAALMHPDDAPRALAAFRSIAGSEMVFRVEFRARGEGDRWRWVEVRGLAVRNAEGLPVGAIGVFGDVTSRKEAEDELERRVVERTAQLEAARRSQESWNYSVSHDLRAPLRAVMSTSRILLAEHAEELSREGRSLLERQAAAAKRLGNLIDELLNCSRLASQDLLLEDLDVSSIAREAAAEQAGNTEKSFVVRVAEGMRGVGDPRLVKLVLSNFLENAMKYSPSGSRIEVGESEGAYFVSDEGIGFDMAYEPKVWRPFERLVLDRDYAGTGIGLYNVAQMVERMGGRAWAESEPGRGSTFWFTLGR